MPRASHTAPAVRIAILAFAAWLCLAVGSAAAATVSGTVLRDESSGLPWAGCDGTTPNVALRYNTTKTTTTCDKATGAFTMSPALGATQRVVVIWIDGAAPAKGAIYTRNNGTANITGLVLTQDRVRVRSETGTTFKTSMFDTYDGSDDPDIPIDDDGTDVETDAGTELHVDAGETYDASGHSMPNVGSLHVAAGASFVPERYDQMYVGGSGEDPDCSRGPGLSTPLCLDPGATIPDDLLRVEFNPTDGDIAVPPLRYGWVNIIGAPTAHLGTGFGQTLGFAGGLTIGMWWGGAGHVDLSRWGPTIEASDITFGYQGGTIRSTSSGTMTVHGDFDGTGTVDLPEYDVHVVAGAPAIAVGGVEAGSHWRFGSLAVRNDFDRPDTYGTGTGMTDAWDSGSGRDEPRAVHFWYNEDDHHTVVGRSAAGGGSWLIRTRRGAVNQWTRTWDATAGDDVANAIEDWSDMWTTELVVGGRIGQNGGDWAVRQVDSTTGGFTGVAGGPAPSTPFGNTDLDGNGTFDTYVYGHATGFDEVTALQAAGDDDVLAIGTTWNGTSQQVRVVRLDDSGQEVGTALTYDTPGADYAPRSACTSLNATDAYIVGGDSTNGGDLFVRMVDLESANIRWIGVTGSGTTSFGNVDVDGNGRKDTLRWGGAGSAERGGGCQSEWGYDPIVYGNRTTGSNTDGFVVRLWDDGTLDTGFGSSGAAWFDSGTDGDLVTGMHVDPVGHPGGMTVVGRFGTNGGEGALMHFDGDGAIDYSWGTDGVVRYDTGSGNDDAFYGTSEPYPQYPGFIVGVADGGSGGGDIRIAHYTFAGELANGLPGKTHVQLMSGDFTDGAGELSIAQDLAVGDPSDAADTVLDTESYDPVLRVDGDVSIANRGWLRLSSTTPTTLRGDLDNGSGGRIHAGAGSVRIRPAGTAVRVAAGSAGGAPAFANSFATLDVDLASSGDPSPRLVRLPSGSTTRVRGALRIAGGSCATRVRVEGDGGVAAVDATGATRSGDFIDVSNVTLTPSWTFGNGSVAGTATGWTPTTPCGSSLPLAPDDLYVDDSDAQAGAFHNLHVSNEAPHLSTVNRTGTTVDQQQVRVWSDAVDGSTRNLLRLDGSATDIGAAGGSLTLNGGGNAPTWTTGSGGRFSEGLAFDGNDRARTTTGGYDSLTSFTVDTWVKRNGTPASNGTIVQVTDGGEVRFDLSIRSDGNLDAGYTDTTGTRNSVNWGGGNVWDGGWHHVAATFAPVGPGVAIRTYVDGDLVGAYTWDVPYHAVSGAQAYIGNGYSVGSGQLRAVLDELRMSTRTLTSDEIAGYVRTKRRHGDLVWDSGTVAACTACDLPAGARAADVTYAGPADTLLDGARYWVTARHHTGSAATPANQWSEWSDADWFETRPLESITVSSGSTVALGSVAPGSDAVATSSLDVWTNGGAGYTLTAHGQSDAWTLSSGMATVAPFTGAPTPASWAPGLPGAGYAGMTVLSATGGKDTARWGTGSDPFDLVNLKYGGLKRSAELLVHARTGYSAATDTVVVGWRVNPALTTPPGAYRGNVTFTAIPNP